MFNHIGLVAKPGDERVAETLEALIAYLRALPVALLFDEHSARTLPSFGIEVKPRPALGEACDLVIIVGGDGTFLSAARSLVDYGVRLLGINLGRLGFLTDIMPDEMHHRLDEVFGGDFVEDDRFLLEARVTRAQKHVFTATALNDVVIHKWNVARLIQFETRIDAHLVSSQRSDGLIVATPTGSTAYALSGGGPLLHPSLDAIALVPICPHTLSSRPIVVAGSSQIDVVMGDTDHPQAQLTCDGEMVLELIPGDEIRINKKAEPIRLIHPPGHDHYATLRAKLHWERAL